MKKALLLIDIQNDYFPKGAMELEGSTEAGRRAGAMLKRFRDDNLLVVHIQHISIRPGATFFLPDTEGVLFHETVRLMPGETVIQKYYPNSFRGTMLLDHLKKEQVGHLTIGGMMTHMCVDATVRAAFDHGFACTVLHDACATRALTFGEQTIPAAHVHGAFLAALDAVYARISGVGEVMEKMSSGKKTPV
jgi:nicotinamidase-related amidase